MSGSPQAEPRDDLVLLEIDAGEFDPIAHLRPRIDGNHTMRMGISPFIPEDEDEGVGRGTSNEDGQDQEFSENYVKNHPMYYLGVFDFGENQRYAVAADLLRAFDKSTAAVSVMVEVVLDGKQEEPLKEEQAILLGKWAAHAAYDYAALNLRMLVANNPVIDDLNLPISPIDPIIQYFSNREALRK